MDSPTPRPSVAELTSELLLAAFGDLTEDQLRDAGIDTLHFLWCITKAGGTVYVKFPGDREPHPVTVSVPGLFGQVS